MMARLAQSVIALFAVSACASGHPVDDSVVAPAGAALIEYRLVHDAPATGLERAEYNGQTLYLERRVVISDADLEVVRPWMTDDKLLLELQLSPEGAARLNQTMADNIGKRMALLLEGRVRSAPVINSAVGSRIQAAVDVSGDDAQRIARVIRARWPQRDGEGKTRR